MLDLATATATDAPVTYTARLKVARPVVARIAGLLEDHRVRIGTRRGRRALDCWAQAVLVCRWLTEASDPCQLAADNEVALSTVYLYLHEGLDVLAQQAPGLRGALLAARVAGYDHVAIDGTLIHTDRVSVPGPTTRKKTSKTSTTSTSAGPACGQGSQKVDLWWSGKHHCHGGNVQVITAPDGWPIWTSPVRPGREHDTTCARTHPGLLPALDDWSDGEHGVLADLGYEGEADRLTCPVKTPTDGRGLDEDTRAANRTHNATRALAERGNALLKHFKALRHVSLCPTRIGTITAAALTLLHMIHNRTT